MPTVRKRGLRRLPTDFAAIGKGEIVRWDLGQIIVRGEYEPVTDAGGAPIQPWESWGEWASTYAACRDAFLASYHERHGPDEVPGAELLFAAYERGENPSGVVIDRGLDYRPVLAGKTPIAGRVSKGERR